MILPTTFNNFWSCSWHLEVPGAQTEPTPQQRPKLQQWQGWILNPLSHQGTPPTICFLILFMTLLSSDLEIIFHFTHLKGAWLFWGKQASPADFESKHTQLKEPESHPHQIFHGSRLITGLDPENGVIWVDLDETENVEFPNLSRISLPKEVSALASVISALLCLARALILHGIKRINYKRSSILLKIKPLHPTSTWRLITQFRPPV